VIVMTVLQARRALVRRPSPRLAEGLLTHLDRTPVDTDLALEQWAGYVQALAGAGWDVTVLDAAPDCPDCGFIEDTVVVHHDLAVLTRPGAPQRRGEVPGVEAGIRAAGYRVARIEDPGTLDGGDVLKVGDTVYVGRGGRTNAAGAAQLAAHLSGLGATVIEVPLTKVLHLKSAVTALPDGTVIGYAPVVDDPGLFQPFLAVPEEPGCHVVLLGEDRLLMSARAPRTAALLAGLGYSVVEVEISEFEKLEGCVTCLSVRMRGLGHDAAK
jgi:dimethylargininase